MNLEVRLALETLCQGNEFSGLGLYKSNFTPSLVCVTDF